MKCSLYCKNPENQIHIFTNFHPIKAHLGYQDTLNYDHIYSDITHQIEVIKVFIEIDKIRREMMDRMPPVGNTESQDPAHLTGAVDYE